MRIGLLVILCITVLPRVGAIAPDLYDLPVEYIRLSCDFPFDSIAVINALTIHEKDILTPDSIRRSLRNLHELDRFGNVEVHAEPFLSGVALTFILTPEWTVDRIRFKGKQTGYLFAYGLESRISRKELLRVIDVKQNEAFSENKLQRSRERLTELYIKFGYGKCSVDTTSTRNEGSRTTDVQFVINKGAPSVIDHVEFIGNEAVSDERLLRQMRSVKGRRFLHSALDIDLKSIQNYYQKQGYLTVRVERIESTYHPDSNSFSLKVPIVEGPCIKLQIDAPSHWWNLLWSLSQFERRPSIEMEALGFPDFDTTDLEALNAGEHNLRLRYWERGYAYAESSLETKEIEEHRFVYHYRIDEGERYKVRDVVITGNQSLSEDILRGYMITTRGERYYRHSLQKDCEALFGIYLEHGFIEPVIQAFEMERDDRNRRVSILFRISEGAHFQIGSAKFIGNLHIGKDRLEEISGLHPGSAFQAAAIDRSIQAIIAEYEKSGFPDASASWSYVDSSIGNRDLVIEITEGSYVTFGKVLIKGYYRTKLGLINRQIPPVEYKPFCSETMMTIQRNLSQTGLFNSVRIQSLVTEADDSERTLLVSLVERPSLFLETGPGYNTDIGASAYLNLYTTNLYGTNRFLGASIFYAEQAEKSQLTYREPEFAGFPVQMEIRLFRNFNEEDDYDLYRYGGRANWTFRTKERFRLILEYRLDEDRPINIQPDADIPEEYRENVKIGSLAPSAILDTRDDPRDPRSGSLISGKIEFARPVYGSEVDFTKTTFEANHFLKLFRRTTLGLSLRAGWGRDLPFQEKFKLGGIKTIRGWGYEDIRGPGTTDLVSIDGKSRGDGGNVSLLGNIEFRMPLVWGLQGVLFFDTGNVWDSTNEIHLNDLKGTLGAGIRFMTPIGPVGLDFGHNVLKDPFDHSQRWSFIIGQTF